MNDDIAQIIADIKTARRRLKRKGLLPNKVLFDETRFTMKQKPKPYRKPGGPSETLDKLRKSKSILVDRVTANRLRATASQRAIPYKSRSEGDLVRITKL